MRRIQQYLGTNLNQINQLHILEYHIIFLVFVPENICSWPILPTEQLRGHVSGISFLGILLHFPLYRLRTLLFELKQQPEVPQLQTARVGNEDIGGLEVQMHKTMRVQVLQC